MPCQLFIHSFYRYNRVVLGVQVDGRTFLKVQPQALTMLANQALKDISHLLRPAHLAQVRKILDDPEASSNVVG